MGPTPKPSSAVLSGCRSRDSRWPNPVGHDLDQENLPLFARCPDARGILGHAGMCESLQDGLRNHHYVSPEMTMSNARTVAGFIASAVRATANA